MGARLGRDIHSHCTNYPSLGNCLYQYCYIYPSEYPTTSTPSKLLDTNFGRLLPELHLSTSLCVIVLQPGVKELLNVLTSSSALTSNRQTGLSEDVRKA